MNVSFRLREDGYPLRDILDIRQVERYYFIEVSTVKNQLILEKEDLRYLSWTKIRNSSGTAGSFLKAYSELGGKKLYYKLSDYDAVNGVVGFECVNELIADRLLDILGIEHLHYQLIHADILLNGKAESVFLCASEDFKEKGEEKAALDAFYETERLPGESVMGFCVRQGWSDFIYRMLVVDYLILNRDRHGANIEVLRNKKMKTLRLAPLFDHGLSLLCRCRSDAEVEAFDVMEDRQVQSYVGSRSALENLKLIPPDRRPLLCPLKESDRAILMDGLDAVISEKLQDKTWEMIWKRWCCYENLCNS